MDYDGLAQEAMRSVIRKILKRTEREGLPGDHHFYVSFDTQADGVILSKRLREQYPKDMTIVLQHRFWDLIVTDERFEVKLTFDGIPERLVVPYATIKVFFDPSVRYALHFDANFDEELDDLGDPTLGSSDTSSQQNDAGPTPGPVGAGAPVAFLPRPGNGKSGTSPGATPRIRPELTPVTSTTDGDGDDTEGEDQDEQTADAADATGEPDTAQPSEIEVDDAAAAAAKTDDDGEAQDDDAERPASVVVSLDAFRKK
ncbi:MAG: ClpXP protease specificity-enhancing factor SspB [Pseudomonadota bacterium]